MCLRDSPEFFLYRRYHLYRSCIFIHSFTISATDLRPLEKKEKNPKFPDALRGLHASGGKGNETRLKSRVGITREEDVLW